jgi:hypothetical protein
MVLALFRRNDNIPKSVYPTAKVGYKKTDYVNLSYP